jgi:archaellin
MFRIRLNQRSISFMPRTWLGRLALAAGAAALLLLAVFLAALLLAAALVAAVLLSLTAFLRARRLRRGLRREAPGIVVDTFPGTAETQPQDKTAGTIVVLPQSGRDRYGR